MELGDGGAGLRRERGQAVEIEVVELRGITAQDGAHLGFVGVVEQLAQVLTRERERAFVVRVVASPHEPVETDVVPRRGVVATGLAHTHPAVATEILGGRHRKDVLVGVPHLAGAAGLADLLERRVEAAQHRR